MIDAAGNPKVLEFNCRLGDPETQPIMVRLKSDLVDLVEHGVNGTLDRADAEWDRRAALGVVLAARGYPESPESGDAIEGLDRVTSETHPDCKVFHAGTTRDRDGKVSVSGGRVLCVTALGDSVKQAQRAAYAAVAEIQFAGMQYRSDIGHRALRAQGRATEVQMDVTGPRDYFRTLQSRIVDALEALDGQPFRRDEWTRPEGGGGIARVIEDGDVFERGGVNYSHVTGDTLPPSATAARPDLADRPWEAIGVSLVLHPRNPYVPTVHMNVRVFVAHSPRAQARRRSMVVRRRHGSHALLRFRRRRDPFSSRLPRALAPFGDDVHAQIQALVRRIFLSQAPEGAARHRRHLLRRPGRRRLRALLRAGAQRRRPLPRRVRARSSSGARRRPTASASATSRRIAAAATWSSISSGTAARSSACSRAAAPRRS